MIEEGGKMRAHRTSITDNKVFKGKLVANKINADGYPIAFALLTDDKEKYIIVPAAGKIIVSLNNYLRKKVRISGKLKTVNALKIILAELIILQPDTDTTNFITFSKLGYYKSLD